jgi:glutamate synthase (NADPH/NADH) small chain
MASMCPKCHQPVDEDIVCCANLKITWKCGKCGKRSVGFAFPFGRCPMCGGALSQVDLPSVEGREEVEAVQTAIQFEMTAAAFYRHAAALAKDPGAREAFERFVEFEEGHRDELEEKYHVHPDPERPRLADAFVRDELFAGVDDRDAVRQADRLYEIALGHERRTRDFFERKVKELPAGPARELYRELAMEEEEHISLLESERVKLAG